jgi:hypothetical protein
MRACNIVAVPSRRLSGASHQPGNPLVVDRQPEPEGQFGVHAW